MLSGLAGDAEQSADRRPGMPGLAGSGHGCGEGVFGGCDVLLGGADPVQDVHLRLCGQGDGWRALTDAGTPYPAGRAQRHRPVADRSGEGALWPADGVVGVVAAHRGVNITLTRPGAHEAACCRTGVATDPAIRVVAGGGGLAWTAGLVRAAVLLVVSVSSSPVRAWIWR